MKDAKRNFVPLLPTLQSGVGSPLIRKAEVSFKAAIACEFLLFGEWGKNGGDGTQQKIELSLAMIAGHQFRL